MKLKLKAFKCAYPTLFTDDYTRYIWQDDKQFEVIFGKNQKEAISNRCKSDECYTFWELKQHIRTRRFPERDLYDQEKSELLIGLSDSEINHLTHSLGVTIGKRCPDYFYRNYSMYHEKDVECEKLVSLGLMENWQKLGSEVYGVTPIGIEAVKTLLLTTYPSKNHPHYQSSSSEPTQEQQARHDQP